MTILKRRQTIYDIFEVIVSGGEYGSDEPDVSQVLKGSFPVESLAQKEINKLEKIALETGRTKYGQRIEYNIHPRIIYVNPNQIWQHKPEYFVHLDEVDAISDTCGEIRELLHTNNMSHAYVKLHGIAKEHKHNVMEEVYTIIKGKGYITISGNKYEIEKGETIAIPKNEWHYLESNYGIELLVVTSPVFDPKDIILKQ